MTHLLLFTIGPVQSFIAQARKLQDLAAGSRMLSDLIRDAMIYAEKKANAYIIFPHFDKNKTDNDYPNRFLAFIEAKDPQKFGEELEEYIKEKFVQDAEKALKDKISDKNVLEHAAKQLNHILKIYWVILPDVDKNNYNRETHQKIERLLGGIKNLRKFEQFTEKGRKCSVNGEYNVVIYRKKKADDSPKWLEYTNPVKVIEHNKDNPVSIKHIAPGEGLSAISFYKRLYDVGNSFDATCEIAYLDTIQIDEKEYKESAIDVQLIYEENQKTENFKKLGINKNKYIEQYQQLKKQFKGKPQKYYAILMFDADHMGQWLSGEYLKENSQLRDFQKQLSRKLSGFAQFAKDYVNGDGEDKIKKGQTIYAGGDDFLGLINLKYLFDVLQTLRTKFKELVSDKLQDALKEPKEEFTFSAGIAIAHYKTPLNYILKEARAAEHSAKEDGDRNALTITVLKRSGEIHKTVFEWYEYNTNNEKIFLPNELRQIVKTLNEKKTSNKFITNFTREFLPVAEKLNKNNKSLISAELTRLLRDNKVEELNNSVNILFEHFINNNSLKLTDFIGLLNIADFISRQINSIE
jgi:CRISPR-associated protein Cmr2